MKKSPVLILLFLSTFVSVEASEPRRYEIPRTEVIPIEESGTDRRYELYIRLPEGYAENADVEYPVIYTTDAGWHFEMLYGTAEFLMPDVILVGISWQKDLDPERAHASRFRDYSVIEYSDPETQARYQGGQAENHLNFIRNEVIRFVESTYRAAPGERTYFGYSLGGQFGAYVLLAHPGTFKNYILGSPSFRRGDEIYKYFDELEAKTASERQDLIVNVFLTIGELEEAKMAVTRDFVSVLQRRRQSGLTLAGLEIIEGSDHAAAFPDTAVRGVRWLSQIKSE